MDAYSIVNALGGMLIITSLAIVLIKSPKNAALMYSVQSMVLVGVFMALGTATGSHELFTWAGTAFVMKVIIVPALIIFACKKMGDAGVGLEPKISAIKILVVIALEVLLCFIVVQGITLPTAEAVKPALAISLAHFFIGLTCIVSQRNIVKQIFGYCLMENGAHVTLALLAPQAPELVEIGITTDALFAVIILLVVAGRVYKQFNSLDADKLTELKG